MPVPKLTKDDVIQIIKNASDVGNAIRGGQKLVFPITISGKKYVVKFMCTNLHHSDDETEASIDQIDEVTARARREVEIMKLCKSPNLVKLGEILLTHIDYKEQSLIYFTEEYIEGRDLKNILSTDGPLPIEEIIKIGRNITEAIRVIWAKNKIHRDIKPGNIMKRDKTGNYVLLDMGLVFDLDDISLTKTGFIPGTPIYFSPEQIDLARKRLMDFRSDLFSLGIVLYEMATGIHPFAASASSTTDIVANILAYTPDSPLTHRPEISEGLSNIIMRLLAKRPHLRYRSCEQLDSDFSNISLKRGD